MIKTKFYSLSLFQSIVLIAFLGFNVQAQSLLKGKVIDESTNDPLIGATVVVKGQTSLGTITDFNGDFSLSVPNDATALIISYTGYNTIEELINGRTELNISLRFGEVLQDVVVVGYGTVKLEDATGSIQSVSQEKFNKGAITGAQELIAGKVAGVSITPDPSPGGGAAIRIRGLSSLGASQSPLFVIDGVPIDNGGASGSRNPLNFLNPNDIESFSVLKDASATAIYGSRGSAGVILITTKKGSANGKIKVSYSGLVSSSINSDKLDVLTGDEFRTLINERYEEGQTPRELLGSANTDWQDEIYQNAIGHDHNLSLSGGAVGVPYRVSLGFTDKNGVLKTDNFNRLTSSINLTPGFFNNTLQIKAGFKSMLNNNDFADRGAIGNAVSYDPTQEIFSGDDVFNGYTTWQTPDTIPNTLAPTNPLALLNEKEDKSRVTRYISTFSADYRLPFMKSMRANVNLAYDVSNGAGTTFIDSTSALSFNKQHGGGFRNAYDSKNTNSLLETYLNYKETFGKNTFDIMGGYSWQHFLWESSFDRSNLRGTPAESQADSNAEELYLVSLFGRLNYNFNEKLYASVVLRRDGTSRFSPETRWGVFPGVSLAYKVIDNNNKYFNNVKLRGGWGVTGQQDIGRGRQLYAYQGLYQTGFDNAQYQFGDEFITTIRPNGYAADIKWEETETYNVAVDFSIIKNRVGGTLEVYRRLTRDLLGSVPLPAGTNLTNELTTNVGNMENQGLELSINYSPILTKNMDWSIGANMAYNENKITKLTISDDPDFPGVRTGGISGGVGSTIQLHTVGYSPNTFHVFEQVYDESGAIIEGEFVDRNEDGMINDDDKYLAGNPFPKYTFGITNNFSYKAFDFSFAGRANIGNTIYNNVETDQGYLRRAFNPSNALVNIHQVAIDNNIENQASVTFSDHYLTDGSFFRMDHITLGYQLKKLIKKDARIYATVQNPFIITPYEGLDPEIFGGIDGNIYPRPTTYLVGVNVNF